MNNDLAGYAERHTSPEPEILKKISRETHLTQVYPQMLTGHVQGTILRMVCAMLKPRRVLEIGTFTGYSAIAMGLALADQTSSIDDQGANREIAIIHTIEVNPELENRIRTYIGEARLERHVILHTGKALEIIPKLNEVWDLVFIDADKPNYLNYYNMVLPRMKSGGFILIDNVLWDGKVTNDPATMDSDTKAIDECNRFIQSDTRVENVMLTVRDGLSLIRKL